LQRSALAPKQLGTKTGQRQNKSAPNGRGQIVVAKKYPTPISRVAAAAVLGGIEMLHGQ